MALNTAKAVGQLRGLTTAFDNAIRAATPFYPQLSTRVNSSGADEQYGILGASPGVREFLGDRKFKQLRAGEFVIKNRTWEISVPIARDDIADDRMGLYGPTLANLGIEAAHHPDELLMELINNGDQADALGFDQKPFFADDHTWGDSGVNDNKLDSTVADTGAVTGAEFKASFNAARIAMINFKGDTGKLYNRPTINRMSDLIVAVPPNLEQAAVDGVTNGARVNGGDTNIVLNEPVVIALPQLTSSIKWFLFNRANALMPFVWQPRTPLSRRMKGDMDIEFREVKFMTEARYAMGYLAWWNAVQTTFSV